MTITLDKTEIDFGDVDAGATPSKTFKVTITETAGQAQKVTNVAISASARFSVSPAQTVAGTLSFDVTVSHTATTTPGSYTGTVTVTRDGHTAVTCTLKIAVVDVSGATLAQTHLYLRVPSYGDTTFQTHSAATLDGADLHAFLRLGAFDWASEPPRAKELLAVIPQAGAATDPDGFTAATQIMPQATAFPTGNIFCDDVRTRSGDGTLTTKECVDHQLTLAGRQAESARLYARGGWRDHSDGNRITTTYGDKVEVIRGNYKMVVLGRQDDVERAMGWDVGGSHVQDYAPGTMPGASFFLEWIDDDRYYAPDFELDATTGAMILGTDGNYKTKSAKGQKGVWLLANTTENVYEYARKAGNFREEIWGDVKESYVGSENPPTSGAFALNDTAGSNGHEVPASTRISGRHYDLPGISTANPTRHTPPWLKDNVGMVRSNPHIIEKTWAVRIDTWQGTESCHIPHIEERTFADTMISTTGSATHRVTSISESTYAKGTSSFTDVDGIATEVTLANLIANNTTAKILIAEATEAPMIFEGTACGAHVEVEVNGGHASIEASGILFDASFHIGKIEIDLGPDKLTCALPKKDELTLAKVDTHLSAKFVALDKTTAALKSDTTALKIGNVSLSNAVRAINVELGI